jgi:hypothetical protein
MDIAAVSNRCGVETTKQSRRHGADTMKRTSHFSWLFIHRVDQNSVSTNHPRSVERSEKMASKGWNVAKGSCMTDGSPKACFFVTAESTSVNVGACE